MSNERSGGAPSGEDSGIDKHRAGRPGSLRLLLAQVMAHPVVSGTIVVHVGTGCHATLALALALPSATHGWHHGALLTPMGGTGEGKCQSWAPCGTVALPPVPPMGTVGGTCPLLCQPWAPCGTLALHHGWHLCLTSVHATHWLLPERLPGPVFVPPVAPCDTAASSSLLLPPRRCLYPAATCRRTTA